MRSQIIIASMSRAGSMWTYNITRSLVKATGLERVPEAVPTDSVDILREYWGKDLGPNKVLCVKSHLMINNFRHAPVKIISPYRDVRDAMMSYMRFTKCDLDRAMLAARDMMLTVDFYLEPPSENVLPVRYDDVKARPMGVINDICDFLSFDLDEDVKQEIAGEYSIDQMTTYVGGLSEENQLEDDRFETTPNMDGTQRLFDPKTGFQSGHITSSNNAGWRDELSKEQQDKLMALTGSWLQKYGFSI